MCRGEDDMGSKGKDTIGKFGSEHVDHLKQRVQRGRGRVGSMAAVKIGEENGMSVG